MKTLYVTKHTAMCIDSTGKAEDIKYRPAHIQNMYKADEDMKVVNNDKIYYAKKGDIILTFYEGYGFTNNVAIIKNKEWKENLIAEDCENNKHQVEKEAWALKHTCSCDCECCDDCGC